VKSPYRGLNVSTWEKRTRALISEHPLDTAEIYEVVLKAWANIFRSGIGSKPFKIGQDLFPRPQIMAYFLHELIPLEFARRYPGVWRREKAADDKDLVHIPDENTRLKSRHPQAQKAFSGIEVTLRKVKIPRRVNPATILRLTFRNLVLLRNRKLLQ
jgi:hypothetical protein